MAAESLVVLLGVLLLMLVVAHAVLLLLPYPRIKKRLHPTFLIATAATMVGLFCSQVSQIHLVSLIALLLIAIGSVLVGIWIFRFCERCGATNRRYGLFHAMTYCHKCGSAL